MIIYIHLNRWQIGPPMVKETTNAGKPNRIQVTKITILCITLEVTIKPKR